MVQFLGSCLVSWSSKKQNTVALSTAEAEYVAAAACCSQMLWIKQQLRDFGIKFECVPIYCDNTSAICISKDPVHHSRVKHILVTLTSVEIIARQQVITTTQPVHQKSKVLQGILWNQLVNFSSEEKLKFFMEA